MPASRSRDFDTGRLEELTVSLNQELYAESAGLACDEANMLRIASLLEMEYRQAQQVPHLRDFVADGAGDALNVLWNLKISRAMDATLHCPSPLSKLPDLRWRDRKSAERATNDPGALESLFTSFLERSDPLVILLEERYAGHRRLYSESGLTPLDTFAHREGATPSALQRLVTGLGLRCRAPFQRALTNLSMRVFGHDEVTLPGLLALHNNRMYEPLAQLFARRNSLDDVCGVCRRLGFSTGTVFLDLEERPNKYAGAFCLPVRIPNDIRISVRPTSPHHLADMLFHEYGHAMHFASIDPSLPFMDRYWIHSGTHETFATLFEVLLGLPLFLREVMGFGKRKSAVLAEFNRFKFLLTGTLLAAGAAAICDAWIETLSWQELEARFANYVNRFTGLPAPPSFARLDPFVSKTDPYPLGYILAVARVSHWLDALEGSYGSRWWNIPQAGAEIRSHMRAGGAIRFDPAWLDPSAFVRRWLLGDAGENAQH